MLFILNTKNSNFLGRTKDSNATYWDEFVPKISSKAR